MVAGFRVFDDAGRGLRREGAGAEGLVTQTTTTQPLTHIRPHLPSSPLSLLKHPTTQYRLLPRQTPQFVHARLFEQVAQEGEGVEPPPEHADIDLVEVWLNCRIGNAGDGGGRRGGVQLRLWLRDGCRETVE